VIKYAEINCQQIGSYKGRIALGHLRGVVANFEASIRYALKGPYWLRAATAAFWYASAVTLGCIGDPSVIDDAYEKAKRESVKHLDYARCQLIVAQLRQSQARVAEHRGELERATALYEEALQVASTVKNAVAKRVMAKLEKDLADIALAKGDLVAAGQQYTTAKAMFDDPEINMRRNSQHCEIGKAAVELQRGSPKKALETLDKVQREVSGTAGREEGVDFKRTEARCFQIRAEVLMALEDWQTALSCLIKALMEFSPTGDLKNSSKCMALAIQIVSESKCPEKLFQQYALALTVTKKTGVPNVAQNTVFGFLHAGLARQSTSLEEKKYHCRAAEEFWRKIGRDDLVRRLDKLR
jgi:tetratricopeptide (TPR) repeat protein